MDMSKLSAMLMELATYLKEQSTDNISDIFQDFKNDLMGEQEKEIKDDLKNEEQELKAKFIEFVKMLDERKNFNIFVTKNNMNTYDLCVVFEAYRFYLNDLSTQSIIERVQVLQTEGYIIENINQDTIRIFIRALWIYNETKERRAKLSDTKDLIYKNADNKKLIFTPAIRTSMDEGCYNVFLYYDLYDEKVLDNLVVEENATYLGSFSDILDAVYENKYIGSKLKLF